MKQIRRLYTQAIYKTILDSERSYKIILYNQTSHKTIFYNKNVQTILNIVLI